MRGESEMIKSLEIQGFPTKKKKNLDLNPVWVISMGKTYAYTR